MLIALAALALLLVFRLTSGEPVLAQDDADEALRKVEEECGEEYRGSRNPQDHSRFYCMQAFALMCAAKEDNESAQADLRQLCTTIEALRGNGGSACPHCEN